MSNGQIFLYLNIISFNQFDLKSKTIISCIWEEKPYNIKEKL